MICNGYRRAFIPGGTCFFTVNLADRSSRMLVERVGTLRDVVREVRQRHPFKNDRAAVQAIVDGDPFMALGVASTCEIREWVPLPGHAASALAPCGD